MAGEGARRSGGRWKSPGRPVVYLAQSMGLAVLENLVHMAPEDFPTGYVSVTASLPDEVAVSTDRELRLRNNWRDLSPQAPGDLWLGSGEAAVLEVPSVVVSKEHNYLLNPSHPDFAKIIVERPALFHFDPRLIR